MPSPEKRDYRKVGISGDGPFFACRIPSRTPHIEEGNAFEADAVKGVADAGDADEGEVRTNQVPQDDVPGEYQDKE